MNQESWNKFIVAFSSPASFLQSWQWGEFQEALGHKVYRIETDNSLQALVVVRKLPLGRTYLEIPKGPVLKNPNDKIQNPKVWEEFVGELRKIGRQEKAVLARINPPYSNFQFSIFNFQIPEILVRQTEPEDTVLVDLLRTEEELMQNMHEKSRYNIRLAIKKGVKIRVATEDQSAFARFLELLDETSKRDGITYWPHERFWKFQKKFFSTPSPREERDGVRLIPHAEFLVGEFGGQILAATIILFFGDTCTYLYAASSSESRTANTPSILLWEAIKLAKARGYKWYDMWGIAPAGAGDEHSWSGITRFKSRYIKFGMTGKEIRGIGTRDLVLDKFYYNIFKIGKKLRP